MLTITETQLAGLTREHMLGRVRHLLLDRSADPAVLAMLSRSDAWRARWIAWYDRLHGLEEHGLNEHGLAVRLCYVLAADAHGLAPDLADVAGEQAEIAMKTWLEERGVLPPIAFDEG
jgi:hypothetical protein